MTSRKFKTTLPRDDHKLFFEALGECGKDFQNIQQYMAQKSGKRSNKASIEHQNKTSDAQEKREQDKRDDDKKREQIRNFYNKLYTELSKVISKPFDDRIEKVNQELYLLINYGEIWKKLGLKFEKKRRVLEELVYQGSSTLRFNNKNIRLRTPPCKALKKINGIGIDEKVKVVSARELPKDVIVEFHPSSNRDWLLVQSMSQNPRVRARLSIQKRLSNIIEFLENKWNITQNQLNRTVDMWLKVTPDNNNADCEHHQRLRLKASNIHELKEVNITRVVPDNHLDLSLNAYIKRLSEMKPKTCETSSSNLASSKSQVNKEVNNHLEVSLGAISTNSKLPISLTTPDSSILLERSCTSDQPSIAQARKHLSFLQSLTGTLEGCENSRTACEDTQDRTLINNNIPALYDEDAALPVSSTAGGTIATQLDNNHHEPIQQNFETTSQNSKSVDFHIPKNVTLGDFFKMNDQTGVGNGGDEMAVEAFPQTTDDDMASVKSSPEKSATDEQSPKGSTKDQSTSFSSLAKPQNHLIEMKKIAEGWTRQDDYSMTIGELFLAFKCPEKIILEYEFEQFTYDNTTTNNNAEQQQIDINDSSTSALITKKVDQDSSASSSSLIFKLLTAASLSLTQIERLKIEQQHKLRDQQNCSKFKRRKGSGQNQPNMTQHDSEATNQRVEEALRQLQPTRLTCYRRQVVQRTEATNKSCSYSATNL